MGISIQLSENEKKLYDELKQLISDTYAVYSGHDRNFQEQEERYKTMAQKAHELHMNLREDGHEPKHHAYMYKNREVPVDEIEFYNHVHPVEDLLAFIDDSDANNDPEDTTIGATFEVRIFSNRWGHYDLYTFERTATGWTIEGPSTFGDTDADTDGDTALYKALDHDLICYPKQTPTLLKSIWEKAKEGATKEEVQRYLNDMAEWISNCEQATPDVYYGE